MSHRRGKWRQWCGVSKSIRQEVTHTSVNNILRNGYRRRNQLRGCPSPQSRAAEEASGDNPIDVAAQGDNEGSGVDDPSNDPQREHRHPGDWYVGITVEVGGGDY